MKDERKELISSINELIRAGCESEEEAREEVNQMSERIRKLDDKALKALHAYMKRMFLFSNTCSAHDFGLFLKVSRYGEDLTEDEKIAAIMNGNRFLKKYEKEKNEETKPANELDLLYPFNRESD